MKIDNNYQKEIFEIIKMLNRCEKCMMENGCSHEYIIMKDLRKIILKYKEKYNL